MIRKFKLAALATALAASFAAQADPVDLFTLDQAFLKDDTNGAFSQANSVFSQAPGVPPGDLTILGGYRDIIVNALSGAVTGSGTQFSSAEVIGGVFSFANGSNTVGQAQLQWDGDDAASIFDINYTGLSNYDLTQGGTLNTFELVTLFSDQGWTFDATIYTDASHWVTVNLSANSVGPGYTYTSPHTSYIPFAAFTNPALCGLAPAFLPPGVNSVTCAAGNLVADVEKVGALVVTINTSGTAAVDLTFDQVTTVPEPGTLALLGASLLGFIGFGRRAGKMR